MTNLTVTTNELTTIRFELTQRGKHFIEPAANEADDLLRDHYRSRIADINAALWAVGMPPVDQ